MLPLYKGRERNDNLVMKNQLSHSMIIVALVSLFLIMPAYADEVAVLHLQDTIQPVSAEFVTHSLARINKDNKAKLAIIVLDTPGGLLTSTRDITTAIMSSKIPVSVYVHPKGGRAASAGFFILLASDFPAMTPGTNAGAAHPVSAIPFFNPSKAPEQPDKEKQPSSVMEGKAVEDTAAFIRSIAEERKRPVEIAEQAVRESKAWSTDECLKLGLIDVKAESVSELIVKLATAYPELGITDPESIEKVESHYSFREKLLSKLASPELIYLLFLAGVIGVFVELKSPGVVFPGLFGAICLILFFYATRIIPVNFAGALFIILAVILFALEFKIVSYGFLTIGGIVSMIIGSAMLIKSDLPGLSLGIGPILLISGMFMVFLFIMLRLVVKAHLNRPMAGRESLVGMTGTAAASFERNGKVFVNGEYWDVRSTSPIQKDQTVRVTEVKNMILIVNPFEEE